jgi:Cu2+-containing amine oxidase
MAYNLWYYMVIFFASLSHTERDQITMEDLQIVETVVRKDPKVIEQCGIIGIPPEDMHKVYCDRRRSIEI